MNLSNWKILIIMMSCIFITSNANAKDVKRCEGIPLKSECTLTPNGRLTCEIYIGSKTTKLKSVDFYSRLDRDLDVNWLNRQWYVRGNLVENHGVADWSDMYVYKAILKGEVKIPRTKTKQKISEKIKGTYDTYRKVYVTLAGTFDRKSDLRYYTKEVITVKLGEIHLGQIHDGQRHSKCIKNIKFGLWDGFDQKTFTLYLPNVEKIEEVFKSRTRTVIFKAYDLDTYLRLCATLTYKTNWTSREKAFGAILETEDPFILDIACNKLELYTDIGGSSNINLEPSEYSLNAESKAIRAKLNGLYLTVPVGTDLYIRATKAGYYYVTENIRVRINLKKDIFMDYMGSKERKDRGNRGHVK